MRSSQIAKPMRRWEASKFSFEIKLCEQHGINHSTCH